MTSRSARIREELGHPVIDGDGHIVEIIPVFLDFVRDHGQGALLEGMLNRRRAIEDLSMEERREGGIYPEPARREIVGHLEQRLELIECFFGFSNGNVGQPRICGFPILPRHFLQQCNNTASIRHAVRGRALGVRARLPRHASTTAAT